MKSIVLVIALLFSTILLGQEIDSVFSNAYKLLDKEPDRAVAEVINMEKKIENFSVKERVRFHSQAALFFEKTGDFEKGTLHWKAELALTDSGADTLHKVYYRLGRSYLNTGMWDQALKEFESCEKYALDRQDTLVYAASFDARASVMSQLGDHKSAIGYYLKSIRILEKIKRYHGLSQTYLNLGVAYSELNDPEKAFKSRKKGFEYAKMTDDSYAKYKSMFAMGCSYNDMEKTDSALYYVLPAMDYFKSENNVRFLNGAYNEVGRTYSILEQHDSAIVYLEKSLDLLRKVGYEYGLPGTLVNYGSALNRKGDYQRGLEACQEALPIVRKMNYPTLEAEICGCLYENFKMTGQSDSALFYFEKVLAIEDSINNVEVHKAILTEELESSFSNEKETLIADANERIEDERGIKKMVIVGAIILFAAALILFLAYRQKQKSTRIIQQEKQYLDNLLHNLVHEFRTPLTLIKGPAEELLKLDQENVLLQMVNKNSDRMLGLVNQVLDFAKIKAGRLKVSNEITHLPLFFQDIENLFRPMASEKQIRLVHQCQIEQLIKIDSDKLYKIVSNILSNAIKYSEDGGSVSLNASIINNLLVIKVIDAGIGISVENQKEVFKKFFQVDATFTRKGEGTGLGLAFVSELVQLMGGEIRLESVLGEGTKVTVELPYESVPNVSISEVKEESKNDITVVYESIETEALSTENSRILIIEDNLELSNYLGYLLLQKGYIVSYAKNGKEGIETATGDLPDLVISDIMMPKLDGYQVVKQIKSNIITDHIPIIILTAKASFDSMIDGLNLGADDYLSKPFKSEELLIRVRNLLNRQEKLRGKYQNKSLSTEQPEDAHPFVQKIESIILSDISAPLSVEELADRLSISRSQLHRKVKSITGFSTTTLMNEIRLRLTLDDIKKTDLSISEITYKFGFNDPAHFSRLFKKQYKVSPSEMRKSMEW